MKIYRLNSNIYEEMTLDEAIDWLQLNCHFTLDDVTSVEETENQSEMMETLLDAYFTIEEKEDEEECWEDDTEEREREYRKGLL